MRKADIRRKPDLMKLGNKITIKQSPEEREQAKITLETAKSQPKPTLRLAQGFSYQFKKKNEV